MCKIYHGLSMSNNLNFKKLKHRKIKLSFLSKNKKKMIIIINIKKWEKGKKHQKKTRILSEKVDEINPESDFPTMHSHLIYKGLTFKIGKSKKSR